MANKLDISTIILGFMGPLGSGCSYFAEFIPSIVAEYKYYKLSDFIKEELSKEGNNDPSVNDLQNRGNDLRRTKGANVLIAMLLDKVDSETKGRKKKPVGIIVDGIKNSAEVQTLRVFPNFFLVSVQARTETRRQRLLDNGRFKSGAEFDAADARDKSEQYEYGQQVSACSYLADIVINNDDNVALISKTDAVRKIYDRYIRLIEYLAEGKTAIDVRPTIDELCMTIAYSLSKSSNCLKRKVGAVVVDIEKAQVTDATDIEKKRQDSLPFIMSSGYNEVPLGQFPCLYHPEYQKCYRDYLQEEFAKNLKYCPRCGHGIVLKQTVCPNCGKVHNSYVKSCNNCHKEIEYEFVCDSCKENIFDLYIPGSKNSPGKLLDMCRSLHAEEMCLLKLANGERNKDMVLYVTTQPCNLCSNKIAISGIKNVVYAEPYTMKESQDILDESGVTTRRFQGVKSSAFFRLYK